MDKKTRAPDVPGMLTDLAELYKERNKLYGDNYKRFGVIMKALFPMGISLYDEDEHNRFGVFVQIVAKITRYAEQFKVGGHPDSLDDTAVYSMMLQELDQELHDISPAKIDKADHAPGGRKPCPNCGTTSDAHHITCSPDKRHT